METFSELLAICAGNSPVLGQFPKQRLVTRSFDVFFDLRLNKRLRKQSWGWWFETPSRPLWRHCKVIVLIPLCSSWVKWSIGTKLEQKHSSCEHLCNSWLYGFTTFSSFLIPHNYSYERTKTPIYARVWKKKALVGYNLQQILNNNNIYQMLIIIISLRWKHFRYYVSLFYHICIQSQQ